MTNLGCPGLSDRPSQMVSFRLSEDEAEAFASKLETTGQSRSQVLRGLVRDWLREDV
jgi:hypothetical protein